MIKDDDHVEDIQILLSQLPPTFPRTGVVHVGAHHGQEVPSYLQAGFERILLIEANPDACRVLHERFDSTPGVTIVNCAVSDQDGTFELQLHTSRSGSVEAASLLTMKRLGEIVKTMHTPTSVQVPTFQLDNLFAREALRPEDYTLMSLDIQGAELMALSGADGLLGHLQGLIVEVSVIEMYEGGATEAQIVEHLEARGFHQGQPIYHTLYDEESTFPAWGECLFLRDTMSESRSAP
jgi:FkbM family methyltransferase